MKCHKHVVTIKSCWQRASICFKKGSGVQIARVYPESAVYEIVSLHEHHPQRTTTARANDVCGEGGLDHTGTLTGELSDDITLIERIVEYCPTLASSVADTVSSWTAGIIVGFCLL